VNGRLHAYAPDSDTVLTSLWVVLHLPALLLLGHLLDDHHAHPAEARTVVPTAAAEDVPPPE
jgi:hypothetical protein